jgi:hypothetical protein
MQLSYELCRFVDRDMFTRYTGLGVGHHTTHVPTQESWNEGTNSHETTGAYDNDHATGQGDQNEINDVDDDSDYDSGDAFDSSSLSSDDDPSSEDNDSSNDNDDNDKDMDDVLGPEDGENDELDLEEEFLGYDDP